VRRPTASGIVLRTYEAHDAACTREVFQAAVRRTALSHYTSAQVQAWAPDDIDLDHWGRQRAAAWTVVAVVGGELVGFADLTGAGEMDMLFVHPDHGRRGIASALVGGVVREAARRDLHRIDVRASRVLQPLLERLGFVVDEDRPTNRIGDQVLANAAMHLVISSLLTSPSTSTRPLPPAAAATPASGREIDDAVEHGEGRRPLRPALAHDRWRRRIGAEGREVVQARPLEEHQDAAVLLRRDQDL
jgi:putative acetyltransferase